MSETRCKQRLLVLHLQLSTTFLVLLVQNKVTATKYVEASKGKCCVCSGCLSCTSSSAPLSLSYWCNTRCRRQNVRRQARENVVYAAAACPAPPAQRHALVLLVQNKVTATKCEEASKGKCCVCSGCLSCTSSSAPRSCPIGAKQGHGDKM
jgi:hypothetical protein